MKNPIITFFIAIFISYSGSYKAQAAYTDDGFDKNQESYGEVYQDSYDEVYEDSYEDASLVATCILLVGLTGLGALWIEKRNKAMLETFQQGMDSLHEEHERMLNIIISSQEALHGHYQGLDTSCLRTGIPSPGNSINMKAEDFDIP